MCRLIFETVKWKDGVPCLLPWHQRRVEASLEFHGTEGFSVPDLASVLADYPGPEGPGVYKCHITYDTRGVVRMPVFEPYRLRMIGSLACVEAPPFLDYSCKWENRAALTALGEGLGAGQEVLILRNGFITDTRYSNVVFGDGRSWVTPDTFLRPGTTRAFLLEQGVIEARPLKVKDIRDFRFCSLMNAMLDPGEVVVDTRNIILP